MKNLVVRTVSGLVLAVVMLVCILYSQWSFGALLLVLLVGGMVEFYGLAATAPSRWRWSASWRAWCSSA